MPRDPIVDEARSARQKIFDACNEDRDILLDRFQEQEKLSQNRPVTDLHMQRREIPEGSNRVQTWWVPLYGT